MKKRRVEGIVVGRKDFGEVDKIIVVFSQKEGKIRSLAKGVRKIDSRRLGALELGNQIKALIHRGRTFDIITEVEVIDSLGIRQDPTRLGAIIFLCELINVLLPEREINPDIYQEFLKTRNSVKQGKIEKIIFFEARLLEVLGYGLEPRSEELLRQGNFREAHLGLKKRIEAIIERPLKSLAFFK